MTEPSILFKVKVMTIKQLLQSVQDDARPVKGIQFHLAQLSLSIPSIKYPNQKFTKPSSVVVDLDIIPTLQLYKDLYTINEVASQKNLLDWIFFL